MSFAQSARMHLRTPSGTRCRLGPSVYGELPLTDDLTQVTCRRCLNQVANVGTKDSIRPSTLAKVEQLEALKAKRPERSMRSLAAAMGWSLAAYLSVRKRLKRQALSKIETK